MQKFYKKLRLFKNDPFEIKEKYFRIKLDSCMRKKVSIRVKLIKCCLNIINDIGIPCENEEKRLLDIAVKKYDEMTREFEKIVGEARIFILEESKQDSGRILKGKYTVHRHEKQTNADKIRSMADSELADFLFKVNTAHVEPCMTGEKDCKWEDYPTHDKGCKDCFKEWLESEVKE